MNLKAQRPQWALLTIAVSLSLLPGCSEPEPQRSSIQGEVLWDSKLLSKGTITFDPIIPGAVGASAEIREGKFSIPAEEGPSPVKHKITIFGYRETGKKVPGISEDGSGMVAETEQIIPAKYNTETTLQEDLGAKTTLKFDLKPE